MEKLLSKQEDVVSAIRFTIDNFKKLGSKSHTPAVTRNRMSILQERWARCQVLHADIKNSATQLERTDHPYFKERMFDGAEDAYLTTSDFMAETLEKLTKPVACSSVNFNNSSVSDCNSALIPLPRINLPKFSGQYIEWVNFRDLFTSLFASNKNLSNVQRLHYLKVSLTGETSLVIKNFTMTDANYKTAWAELQDRYNNSRVIVTSHLHTVIDLPPMRSESAPELKRVFDLVTDSIHALRNLDRVVDDDFVVALTVRKLDSRTRRVWELHLGDTDVPPLFSDLSKFFLSRLQALEAIF